MKDRDLQHPGVRCMHTLHCYTRQMAHVAVRYNAYKILGFSYDDAYTSCVHAHV